MLLTEQALFEVVGQQNNHLWLEVLDGGDRGIRISVPVRDSFYSDELQSAIEELSEGDILEATLVSEDEERPNWKIDDYEQVGRSKSGPTESSLRVEV